MDDFTRLLDRLTAGDDTALDLLLPQVYLELRRMAASKLAWEQAQSLAATALVHEAYLRLFGGAAPAFANRRHFFAAASEAMRRVLIDRARRRQSTKRGGQLQRSNLDPDQIPHHPPDERLLAVDEALERLREVDPQAAELVLLRYFSGLTLADAANVLQIPPRSADRLWAFAKSWLYAQIEKT